jgi:ribosome-associated toxin RatA of RatAB toxin-antitoxin module
VCWSLASHAAATHPHPSVLKPITKSPAAIALNAEEQAEIRSGDAILRQTQGENGGRGVAVQLVKAPAALVWDTILAYDEYPQWVDDVESCEVYQKKGTQLFVAMKSSFMWITSNLYTINDVHRDLGYMSWVLDRTRESDVQDMIGYWRVEQIESEPPMTRLDYATEIVVGGVPDFIVTHLTEGSLVDGTAWVKREAEKLWIKRRSEVAATSGVDASTTSDKK